jgi:hypothetical protein
VKRYKIWATAIMENTLDNEKVCKNKTKQKKEKECQVYIHINLVIDFDYQKR